MPKKPLAFLTMDCLDGFVIYDHLVKPSLSELGWSVVDIPWRTAGVRWNIDKQYLKELEAGGLVTVPTAWIRSPKEQDILDAFDRFGTKEVVIKPTIGAGARDTLRMHRDGENYQVFSLFQDRMTVVQPFVESVQTQGEWSLFFFSEKYSHTVLKIPKPGDFRVQEE